MAELLGCPFCACEIKHVESMAKSFDPPRAYHEYQHPRNGCVLDGEAWGFTDDPAPRQAFIERWNRRPAPPLPDMEKAVEAIAEAINDARYDTPMWRDRAHPSLAEESQEAREYAFRLARAALLAAAPFLRGAEVEETGWLIEMGDPPEYWSLLDAENQWVRDSLKALRFARKADADAYIADIGWTEPRAVEHMWLAAAQPKERGDA